MTDRILTEILPAKARACRDCPWRCRRSGRLASGPHPALLYLTHEEMRAELWDAIRNGVPWMRSQNSCPWMCSRYSGRRVCSGATVLVTRELELLKHGFGGARDAYHHAHPDGLTPEGVDYWHWRRRTFPAEFSQVELDQRVDRDHGAAPKPIVPDIERDPVSGVPRIRLQTGRDEFGFCPARYDDCLRPALATLLQVSPDQIPDLRPFERMVGGDDPAVIERESWATIEAWLLERDLQSTFHDTVPDRERWIGVCRPELEAPFTDHCVVMSYGAVLYDTSCRTNRPITSR